MTTLKDTVKPSEQELLSILPGALQGRDEDAYVRDFLAGLSQCVKSDARYYRSFGPWWPALKQLLVYAGLLPGSDALIDIDVAAIYRYDRDAYTLLAAALYQSMRLSTGALLASSHMLTVEDDADDDIYEYVSYDQEFEGRVVALD